jgi:rare lipoprotein A
MDIAMAAKRGEDTRGMEIAMNQRHYHSPPSHAIQPPPPGHGQGYTAQTYRQAAYQPPQAPANPITTGHVNAQGNFMPDHVVRQMPVNPTNLYVQAGSFGNSENAARLAETLKAHGNAAVYPATINGQAFYRVRIGPIENIAKADQTLARIAAAGQKQAIIVVE